MSALQGAAVAWGQRRLAARAAAAALAAVFALLLLIAGVVGALQQQSAGGGSLSGAGLPRGALPFLRIYEDAARVYGVSPFLLMAVHEDETTFGTSRLPGVTSGVNFAGCCAGPMQFYVSSTAFGGRGATWEGYRLAYRRARLPRPAAYPNRFKPHPSVYDSYDSIYAAAMYFKGLGAGPRLDQRSYQALISYKGTPPASIPYARHDYERALELQRLSQPAPGGGSYGGSGKLAWPTPTRQIISPFGMRWGRLHAGIDIPVPNGTRLAASAIGRVTLVCAGVSPCSGYGNFTCV
ncbi:MAG: hypothetical protein WKF96_15255, partial [Solirubrobacteraceae bacterium]